MKLCKLLISTFACSFAAAMLTSCAASGKGGASSAGDQLTTHIVYLTQPALKGRKTGTRGAALARAYIDRHFSAIGLQPWNGAEDFEVPFGPGKNMIGVLPGSDPALRNEYVLLSAHYDHEGKRDGKIYPGAADNASGVAVLLEMARKLSANRPARSVIFAAFDGEERMMLGSFAFSVRPEVVSARIAGVINVDMLGRNFLDVITNAVFVAGTESYPKLRTHISDSANRAALRVFPIGTDLVGPRSDHVAFEDRNVPCLFFSCGTFRDYHQPTDTPEKLDYGAIRRSAEVILETAIALADAPQFLTPETNNFAAVELTSVSEVLAEAAEKASGAGIRSADVEKFRALEKRARDLLANGNFTFEQRESLAAEASGVLAPYVLLFGSEGANASEQQRQYATAFARLMQSFYFRNREAAMQVLREFAAHFVAHSPGAFRTMPRFSRDVYVVSDRDISLIQTGPGRFRLNVVFPHVEFVAEVKRRPWLINSFSGHLSVAIVSMDAEGNREELQDLCLLTIRNERNQAKRLSELAKVYEKLTATSVTNSYPVLLQERLARGGFADEADWVAHCLQSGNPDVQLRALSVMEGLSGTAIDLAICQILADPNTIPEVRVAAMKHVKIHNTPAMETMCELLWNPAPVRPERFLRWWDDPENPFKNRPMLAFLNLFEDDLKRNRRSMGTVSGAAYKQLKEVTGRDFGPDETRWLEWLRKRSRSPIASAAGHHLPQ